MSNKYGGAGPGSWCTPRWLADLLGRFDLDPCSNERSDIIALTHEMLPGNGLALTVPAESSVFCNPPYSRGVVIKWVRHYRHTRFTFLLKWAPDTGWFHELIPHCTHVWHPFERIEFEPPPGTKASSNPFPHALYMRDPPADRLKRLATRGLVSEVRPWLDLWLASSQTVGHGTVSTGTGSERAGGEAEDGAGGGGSGAAGPIESICGFGRCRGKTRYECPHW